jgi:hypothetical protein
VTVNLFTQQSEALAFTNLDYYTLSRIGVSPNSHYLTIDTAGGATILIDYQTEQHLTTLENLAFHVWSDDETILTFKAIRDKNNEIKGYALVTIEARTGTTIMTRLDAPSGELFIIRE